MTVSTNHSAPKSDCINVLILKQNHLFSGLRQGLMVLNLKEAI